MSGERLSERPRGNGKLTVLIDYYLADMQRRGCTRTVCDDPRAVHHHMRKAGLIVIHPL